MVGSSSTAKAPAASRRTTRTTTSSGSSASPPTAPSELPPPSQQEDETAAAARLAVLLQEVEEIWPRLSGVTLQTATARLRALATSSPRQMSDGGDSAALVLTTSSLLTRLCVSCSCRSTFGHHLLGVLGHTSPRIGSPPIARGCASPRRPVYFPPLSAAHHEVVGPRAVFATPLAPTGTLLVASMATVNYHLAVGVAGRCMGAAAALTAAPTATRTTALAAATVSVTAPVADPISATFTSTAIASTVFTTLATALTTATLDTTAFDTTLAAASLAAALNATRMPVI